MQRDGEEKSSISITTRGQFLRSIVGDGILGWRVPKSLITTFTL